MRAPRPPSRGNHVWSWLGHQLLQLAGLVAQVLGVGVVLAMGRRQFHWRAFLLVCGVMLTGTFAVGAALAKFDLGNWTEPAMWGMVMGVMALAGFAGGMAGRRVGVWESYAATGVTAAALFVQFSRGWSRVWGSTAARLDDYHEWLAVSEPGVHYLGPMWERLLALGSLGGFLVAVFGGSLAYLLYADGASRDAGLQFEWQVALRHLSGRRRGPVSVTALVAVLGIALGVASLVTVTAVMSGYQEDIQAKILSVNAHLVVRKYGIDFSEYSQVMDRGGAVAGVLAGGPFVFNEAMLSTGADGVGVLIKGVLGPSAGSVTDIAHSLCERVEDQKCVPFSQPDKKLQQILQPVDGVDSLLLGLTLYNRLQKELEHRAEAPGGRVLLGQRVTLTTPVGVAGARGNAPKRLEFRVAGVFFSGMHEFDSRLIYLDLHAAQRLLGMGNTVTGVEFRVQEPDKVAEIARHVLATLGRYPYHTLDWRELNANIFTALKMQKIVMFLVLCFIVIVASFNIASTLFMAVVEKARDIAVLKSMGARDAAVMKIFVLQGWLTGGIGTALGVILGLIAAFVLGQIHLGIAADVYMVEALKVRVMPAEVILVVLAALGISHLATLYPALKAARQRPVDAMRFD